MAWEMIVAFLLVSFVATATPGPSVLYVLSAGLSGGTHGYGRGAIGILLADAMYFLLSMAGLGAFLLASYRLFVLVKWLGAAYLVWLGLRLLWQAFVRPETASLESSDASRRSRWFSGGFMVHAANPKALLYFGSILPQFLRPGDAILPQVIILGVLHLLVALTVLSAYGLFASRIRVYVHNPKFCRTLHAASGSLLIAAGAGLASLKR